MSSFSWRATLCTGLGLGLGIGQAQAAALVSIPSDVSTLGAALEMVDSGGTIVVEAGADISGENCVAIDQDLTLRGDGSQPRVPGLEIGGGVVNLEGLTLSGGCPTMTSSSVGSYVRIETHLEITGGTVTASDIVLDPWDKPGIVVSAEGVQLSGLVAHGNEVWPALIVEPSLNNASVTVHASDFSDNLAGAIRVNGDKSAAHRPSLTVRDSSFNRNVGSDVGDLYVTFAEVEVSGSSFVGTGFEDTGGEIPNEAAFILVHDSQLLVSDSTFTEGRANDSGAISAVQQDASYGDSVTLERVSASRVSTPGLGGLLYVEGGPVVMRYVSGSQLTADYGSLVKVHPGDSFVGEHLSISNYEVGTEAAIYLNSMASARVSQSRVCGGRAVYDNAAVGVALYGIGALEFTNNVIQDLEAPNGELMILGYVEDATVRNNTLTGSAVRYLVVGLYSNFRLFNNIFSHSPGAYGFTSWGGNTPVDVGYNLWYSLNGSTDNATDFLESATDVNNQEPSYWQFWNEQDCGTWPLLNVGSPAIDAGDPAAIYNDIDGTRSDIGAFGGPEGEVPDEDGDGVSVLTDCDDHDAARSPELDEILNDGVDNDCDDTTLDLPPLDDSGLNPKASSLAGGCAGCAGVGSRGEIMTPLFMFLALLLRRSR